MMTAVDIFVCLVEYNIHYSWHISFVNLEKNIINIFSSLTF